MLSVLQKELSVSRRLGGAASRHAQRKSMIVQTSPIMAARCYLNAGNEISRNGAQFSEKEALSE